MLDLVKLIGRDVSNIPIHIYNFNDKTTGWIRRPRRIYELNDKYKPIIYLKVFITRNIALAYDTSGKQYTLLFVQGDIPKEFLLDYCIKNKIPYYA